MLDLINLVPDPSTTGVFECRPAAIVKADFSGSAFSSGFSSGFGSPFSNPGFISIQKTFGNYVYGMIATSLSAGHDQPFVFDLVANQFIFVSGITANNVPVSPATSGAWIPPQIDMIGAKVVVVHSGFSGAFGAFFGYFDITTPTAPVWGTGNCSGANFPTFLVAPTGVAQFGDRAYFIHNLPSFPAVIFSDILNPLSNSTGAVVPIITFGDNVLLTAIAGLPLNNLQGGIIQALMVFKNTSNIYQITGDAATNNLAKNTLNVPTGTLAPRTVCPTPLGLAFVSPDGLRIIDFTARVSDGIGSDGQGITVPLIYATVPSRQAAGANGAVIRITTQNDKLAGTPYQEFWYDFDLKIWTGPHTSTITCYSTYQNTFIVVLQAATGKLFTSDYQQSVTSTFVENGTQLTWAYATSFLPDTDQMVNCAMTETTLALALVAGQQVVTVYAVQEDGGILDAVTVPSVGTAPLWGTAIWGSFIWGGVQSALSPRQLQWHVPICFARLLIYAFGTSSVGFKAGTLHMRYQVTRVYSDESAVATNSLFTLDVSQLGGSNVLGP